MADGAHAEHLDVRDYDLRDLLGQVLMIGSIYVYVRIGRRNDVLALVHRRHTGYDLGDEPAASWTRLEIDVAHCDRLL